MVTLEDIRDVFRKLKPHKAPGIDGFPPCFLKACGKPLQEILAILATKSFELGFFPTPYKHAKTIVLPKPGKLPAVYNTPSGYRPISLLPILGKVIEATLAKKLQEAAEKAMLLPEEQFGCRKQRSTEGAIFLLVSLIKEAYHHKASASLLQLD